MPRARGPPRERHPGGPRPRECFFRAEFTAQAGGVGARGVCDGSLPRADESPAARAQPSRASPLLAPRRGQKAGPPVRQ